MDPQIARTCQDRTPDTGRVQRPPGSQQASTTPRQPNATTKGSATAAQEDAQVAQFAKTVDDTVRFYHFIYRVYPQNDAYEKFSKVANHYRQLHPSQRPGYPFRLIDVILKEEVALLSDEVKARGQVRKQAYDEQKRRAQAGMTNAARMNAQQPTTQGRDAQQRRAGPTRKSGDTEMGDASASMLLVWRTLS